MHANSNPTQNHPNPNPQFIFLALCSVWLSPNQANNFKKLTLSIFKKQDNGLIIIIIKNRKQVEKKTKPVLEGGFWPLTGKQ